MKQKLLKIEDVKVDETLYPREHPDFITIARYVNALNSGAEFPPIVVAKLNGEYLLVDGNHRLKANKGNKETHIQAEVLEGLTEKEIYIEAVKRNMTHGKQFNTFDVTKIIVRLEDLKLSKAEIQDMVRIPSDKLTKFVAKRMTSIAGTNERIVLKKPFTHLSKGQIEVQDSVGNIQKFFKGSSQENIFNQAISLIENDLVDLEDKEVLKNLTKLQKLLSDLILPKIEKPKFENDTEELDYYRNRFK